MTDRPASWRLRISERRAQALALLRLRPAKRSKAVVDLADFSRLRERVERIERWAWGRTTGPELSCDFCGKRAAAAAHIIAGPKALICDECVGLCVEIIKEKRNAPAS